MKVYVLRADIADCFILQIQHYFVVDELFFTEFTTVSTKD